MRMWMVDPEIMCRQHLLGEHCECHMFIGALKKQTSIAGYIDRKILDPRELAARHASLAFEMKHRGYFHSEVYDFVVPSYSHVALPSHPVIDPKESLRELLKRCPRCDERFNNIVGRSKPQG